MSDRASIYIGEALRRLLEKRPEESDLWTRSGILNRVAARYQEICRRHCPTLTFQEWRAVLSTLDVDWVKRSAHDETFLPSVWARVYDAGSSPGAGEQCDMKALAERMHGWDYATTVALVDAVERYWAAGNEGEPSRQSIEDVVGAAHVAP
jgi:hypothetical protein